MPSLLKHPYYNIIIIIIVVIVVVITIIIRSKSIYAIHHLIHIFIVNWNDDRMILIFSYCGGVRSF